MDDDDDNVRVDNDDDNVRVDDDDDELEWLLDEELLAEEDEDDEERSNSQCISQGEPGENNPFFQNSVMPALASPWRSLQEQQVPSTQQAPRQHVSLADSCIVSVVDMYLIVVNLYTSGFLSTVLRCNQTDEIFP